jgi:hypothetical protein
LILALAAKTNKNFMFDKEGCKATSFILVYNNFKRGEMTIEKRIYQRICLIRPFGYSSLGQAAKVPTHDTKLPVMFDHPTYRKIS